LTGRERYGAQQKSLTAMGVPYKVRYDNSPAVLREDLNPAKPGNRPTEPDWSALTGKGAA